ncbi:hypothetical protein HYH03_018755 [Edaphochlamys debaryana]|uniref:Glycosyltransferase family 1 protein n=1 Tax=Edaphochlamys debaryana TaxID=47281 RepID=A0A835XE18_9CHLO|nr:hypothetical protein HYH03_018755 [Edaphochlamys debaryana]|eukprot:KAG2482313.1 hypothetical protein HYH03_018755 [Edaphochlamys debaryana]
MVAAAGSGRYTIYNDITNHWHVFAGVIAAVRTYLDPHPDLLFVSAHPVANATPPLGVREWLGDTTGNGSYLADWRNMPLVKDAPDAPLNVTAAVAAHVTWGPADVLICVSPELDPDRTCTPVAQKLRPKHIIVLIHRSEFIKPGLWFLDVEVESRRVPVHMIALAPHVMHSANRTLHGQYSLDWGAVVAPYTSPTPCSNRTCLDGFVVQGSLRRFSSHEGSGMIRNYDSLWGQITGRNDTGAVRIKVLGKGKRQDLGIPPALENVTSFHSGISFPTYWELIAKSFAIVPMHGTKQYYTMRCSSNVLASLTTCVPLVADDALLGAYTFLQKEHVFYQAPGETEMDVMLRVMAMSDEAMFAKRAAVCRLREAQLRRAAEVFQRLVAA